MNEYSVSVVGGRCGKARQVPDFKISAATTREMERKVAIALAKPARTKKLTVIAKPFGHAGVADAAVYSDASPWPICSLKITRKAS